MLMQVYDMELRLSTLPQGTLYLTNVIPSFPYRGQQIIVDPGAQPFLSYNPLVSIADGRQPVYSAAIIPTAPEEVEELEVENVDDGDDAGCQLIPRRCATIPTNIVV